MGRVDVEISATNFEDLADFQRGRSKRKPRAFRAQALVDTGASKLYLQNRLIKKLGLRPMDRLISRTMSDRTERRTVFSPIRLEIQGRASIFPVVAIPDSLPNIVGQIPLEELDWVVDPKNRKLIPNPEHKHGEHADEF